MNTAGSTETIDRQFCWQQLAASNRLFRVSRIFAAPATADILLPLYALFACIEQVCAEFTDEDVARKKINWWREECLQREIESSNHPVLRELQRSGASEMLDKLSLAELFAGAEARLDAPAPAGCEDLESLCRDISQPQVDLEIGVCGSAGDANLMAPDQVARNGLLQLIRERRNWWLPLNLMARHGINRTAIADASQAEAVSGLFKELLATAGKWGEGRPVQREKPGMPSQIRHLFILGSLNSRKLQLLQKRQPSAYVSELNRLRMSDVFAAWKIARGFNRR